MAEGCKLSVPARISLDIILRFRHFSVEQICIADENFIFAFVGFQLSVEMQICCRIHNLEGDQS